MVTYHDLFLNARVILRDLDVEAVQLEAQEILCAASGKSREELLRDLPLYAAERVTEQTMQLLNRRRAGEPLAYLLGEWEFCGLPVSVSPEVLIPRVDTEVLAQRAIALLEERGGPARLLDLCAGTGCVGIAAAAAVNKLRAVLVDCSDGAVKLCKQNIRRNGLSARVSCVVGDAREEPNAVLGHFDVLACNPPYIPTGDLAGLDPSVRDFEPRLALDGGPDGLDFFRCVANLWSQAVKPGGSLLFEVGIGQAEAVAGILRRAGYEEVWITNDTAGIARVVEGRKAEEETQEEP